MDWSQSLKVGFRKLLDEGYPEALIQVHAENVAYRVIDAGIGSTVFRPGVQLEVRVMQKVTQVAAGDETGIEAVQMLRKLRQPFVKPAFLVAIVIELDQVLEFVGDHGQLLGRIGWAKVKADVDHLILI